MLVMALAAAHAYFARHVAGYARSSPDDLDPLVVVETFTAPAGWVPFDRPERELTGELVGELDTLGVRAVQVYAYGRRPEFGIAPATPSSPAYLTDPPPPRVTRVTVSEEESAELVRRSGPAQPVPLVFGPGLLAIDVTSPDAGWALLELAKMRGIRPADG